MTQPLSPEALAWLRQSVLVDGSTYSRALLHLLERVEALEARDKEDANCWASVRQSMHRLRERIEALEQRPVPGFAELAAPTPEAAPVATDQKLADCYTDAAKVAILNRKDYDKALTPGDVLKAQIRAVYNLGRQHGAAATQPAPPPAPAGGFVERVGEAMERHVAAWLDQKGQHGCSLLLREEVEG